MGLALKPVLTHDARQMQVAISDRDPEFLLRFSTGARVWRFAFLSVKLASAGTPKPAIRFLGAFQKKNLVSRIEAI